MRKSEFDETLKKMGITSITFYPLKKFKGSVVRVTIALLTGGIHQLSTLLVYRCPCVDLIQLPPRCRNDIQLGSAQCALTFNFLYGISFVIAPAVGLFFLGFALQPTTWNAITGWLQRKHREWRHLSALLCKVTGRALISPVTWICITMIDGERLSCAITPLPYDVGGGGATYSSCREVGLLT